MLVGVEVSVAVGVSVGVNVAVRVSVGLEVAVGVGDGVLVEVMLEVAVAVKVGRGDADTGIFPSVKDCSIAPMGGVEDDVSATATPETDVGVRDCVLDCCEMSNAASAMVRTNTRLLSTARRMFRHRPDEVLVSFAASGDCPMSAEAAGGIITVGSGN